MNSAAPRFPATAHNDYPRLLPPPIDAIIAMPYAEHVNHGITAALKAAPQPQEITLALLALCHNNLILRAPPPDIAAVEGELLSMDGAELAATAKVITLGVKEWLALEGRPARSASATPSDTSPADSSPAGLRKESRGTPRSSTATAEAIKRDTCCIISGEMFSIEVCHIFAYSLGSSAALLTPSPSFQVTKPNLWLLLHLLAGPTTTALVESYLLSNHVRSQNPSGPGTSINRLENLMTFSANVHQYWAKCLFTLTPIGDPLTFPPPLTAYDCIFKWMPGYTRAALDLTQVLDPGTPLSEQDDPDLQKASIPDFRSRQARHGGEVVMLRKSGDIITLRTIDPEGMPLPHPDLLRLQAALAEVVRCAGAASEEAEFEDDEDSLDNWDVGENNQENEEFEVEFKVVNDDLESGHEVDARGQQRAVKQIPYLLKRFLDSMDGNPDNGSSNLEAV